MTRERRKIWRQRVALVVGSLLGAFVVIEVVLRLAGISYPTLSRPDPDRGWVLRPNAVGTYSREGGAPSRINSRGFRDREHTTGKEAGTYRIAVLGDSFTEAREVPAADAFWSVLESTLNERRTPDGARFEVLNFGVRGYGTAQQLLTLRCCVLDFAPDLVLVAFATTNDVYDNYAPVDESSTRFARPYFVRLDDQLEPDFSFRSSPSFLLSRFVSPFVGHSRMLQLAMKVYYETVGPSARNAGPATPDDRGPGTIRVDRRLYREPGDGTPLARAWEMTEDLLRLMSDETSTRGSAFAVVTLSNGIQVFPDSAVRHRLQDELQLDHLFYPDFRIKRLGERHGFPVLNLAPALQAYADVSGAALHGFENTVLGFGHWNRDGHRVAGIAIADWLFDAGILSHGSSGGPR